MKSAIPYELFRSSRARRARIEVLPRGHVRVVVPRRFDPDLLSRWLETKRDWIERTRQRFLNVPESAPGAEEKSWELPGTVSFRAIGQEWRVDFAHEGVRRPRLRQDGPFQVTFVVPSDTSLSRKRELLRRWTDALAKDHLLPWLARVSAETGLGYRGASVRAQRTRWGSCSARHSISLNRRLMFLPPECVRYILIHELCHTAHLDHSSRFWKRVAGFEPGWKDLQRQMRSASQYVPAWHE